MKTVKIGNVKYTTASDIITPSAISFFLTNDSSAIDYRQAELSKNNNIARSYIEWLD